MGSHTGLRERTVWLPFYHCVDISERQKIIYFIGRVNGIFSFALISLHKVIVVIKYSLVGF